MYKRQHDCPAAGLRQRAAVREIGIHKLGVPGEIVVDGMVGVGIVLSAVTDVEGRDAQVIRKCGVIGAIPQCVCLLYTSRCV